MVVNIWHPCEGDVTKLYYTTRGKEPVVMIGDLNFDGRPDTRTVWNGNAIREFYGMYQEAWHRLEKGKMLIGDTWQPVRFKDGEWRIRDPSDLANGSNDNKPIDCKDPQ